jgi:hypothetical protein
MADWIFQPPTVEEAPFAWEVPLDRYRMKRGVTILEIMPNVWEAGRYLSYTEELDIINAGLRYYAGGHEHIVDDATRAELIAYPGLGITAANFTPYP